MSACRHLFILILAFTTFAGMAEQFVVVRIVDRADDTTFAVMSPSALNALQQEISDELPLHAKALAMTRTAWAADPGNPKSFPASAIGRRSASELGTPYTDEVEAQEKCERARDRALEKVKDEDDKRKSRISRYPSDKRKEKLKEFEAEAAAERAIGDKVRTLYEKQLSTLKGTPPAP